VALVVVLFLLMTAAWTWRLWPRVEAGTIDESVRLEQLKLVAGFLSKAPPEVVKPILASLAEVSDSQLAVLHEWVEKPSAQQLRELTVQKSLPVEKGVREALLLAWLGQAEKGPLMESFLMIAASGERLGEDVKLYALERLGREALREEQPKVAVAILERAAKLPNATWDTVNQLVEGSQTAGEPEVALAGLRAWIQKEGKDKTGPKVEDARDLEVELMLQAGLAEEALSGQLEALQAAPPDLLSERVLDRAWACAVAANQTHRLAPWIEKHLAAFSEQRIPWQGLMGRSNLAPEYRRWLQCLTSVAEGTAAEGLAFDLYLRLAATGEVCAVARLCDLAMRADKAEDLRAFVKRALQEPALATAVLAAAQEQLAVGKLVAAELRERPRDRELHFAAAAAEAAARPVEQAAMVWQSFLRRFPDDEPARRQLVKCHLAARQTAMARRVLDEMEGSLTEAEVRQREMLRQL
jgi:hypothetical protein